MLKKCVFRWRLKVAVHVIDQRDSGSRHVSWHVCRLDRLLLDTSRPWHKWIVILSPRYSPQVSRIPLTLTHNIHFVQVLTSDSRIKMQRCPSPFPQESVGGWRNDEVQWMSLELVDNRKGILPQTLHQLPVVQCTFLPFIFLQCCPFYCTSSACWDIVKRYVWRRRVNGSTG